MVLDDGVCQSPAVGALMGGGLIRGEKGVVGVCGGEGVGAGSSVLEGGLATIATPDEEVWGRSRTRYFFLVMGGGGRKAASLCLRSTESELACCGTRDNPRKLG